jgi:hypothetical protein
VPNCKVFAPFFALERVDGYNSNMAERRNKQSKESLLKDKRRIAQRVIGVRMGIESNWGDAAAIPPLPEDLPQNGEPKLTIEETSAIEACIIRLVNLGCIRNVLYWCIQEFGTDADRLVGGGASMATREDMAGLSKKVKGVIEATRRYRDELLVVAEACPEAHPLRRGWLTEPAPLASEQMTDLLDHLSWLDELAESWQSPNVNSLMKNKGILYLLAYVWLHTQEQPETKAEKRHSKHSSRQASPYRLPRQNADVVTEIAYQYRWKGSGETKRGRNAPQDSDDSYKTEDFQDKLQDFCTEHPSLFKNMLSLLRALDKEAAAPPSAH